MSRSQAEAGTLIITGCCYLLSLLLSFTPFVAEMEAGFYRQLLALTPSFTLGGEIEAVALPFYLQQLTLLAVFGLIVLNLLWVRPVGPTLVFIILSVFAMLMTQMLLAVLQQIWLPSVWATLSFLFTSLLLYAWGNKHRLQSILNPSAPCQIDAIKHHVAQKDYTTAVLMLKHCPFSDEMFEIAYELGLKLEQQENWVLARFLYVWLVQFDPGMQDFVERIERIINPLMDQDMSITEITETKNLFGHYQLVGKKARGATATVYEAFDIYTQKRIALKMLNQTLDDSTGERDVMTFLHEAMTISHLDHPNIVKIHDADIHDDHAYIAMEYIAGYPMSERLRRKQYLTAAESLRIMHAVLDALVIAHKKGIVHGDIKPANIMYDQQKRNYIITDFGAAYSSHQPVEGEKKIVGTPAYMSPEQLSGARLDGRSDLFSLAVTIYHLLTGEQPFKGEKLSELKKNVLTQDVDTSRLSIPIAIRQVLDKALQKKTYQRFADASQMLQAVIHCEKILENNGSN